MSERKTLALNPEAATAEAPALKKKGRGWEISEKRLDVLHEQARELRRHSSEAHKALAEKFSKADLGRYTFKRFAVVGSAIVDFNCHNLGLALAICRHMPLRYHQLPVAVFLLNAHFLLRYP